MTTLALIAAVISTLALAAVLILKFGDRRYGKGLRDGYDLGYMEGRKAADNWWYNVEREVEREREQIWREDGAA
jgi:hypothetical protein